MSQPWALAAPRAAAVAIARLPRRSGLAICLADEELWLRGKALDDELDQQLRLVPGGRRFALLADNQLVPTGKVVPRGHLPDGPWQLFEDWLEAVLAAPAIATIASTRRACRRHTRRPIVSTASPARRPRRRATAPRHGGS